MIKSEIGYLWFSIKAYRNSFYIKYMFKIMTVIENYILII